MAEYIDAEFVGGPDDGKRFKIDARSREVRVAVQIMAYDAYEDKEPSEPYSNFTYRICPVYKGRIYWNGIIPPHMFYDDSGLV